MIPVVLFQKQTTNSAVNAEDFFYILNKEVTDR
jgi:hypothetical protein